MTKPRRTLDELPGFAQRGGYVYALLFGSGIVKVGRTDHARNEVTGIRRQARAFGTDLADWWVSKPHAEWVRNEQRLIDAARAAGRRTGPGYFAGVDFRLLAGGAHDLPFTSTGAYASGRRWRRRGEFDDPDKRMAVAVRLRGQGLTVREIAGRQSVSHSTIIRDLARWERVRDEMPLEIIRLSRAPGTSHRNTGPEASSSADPQFQPDVPEVIPFRRPA